MEKSKDNVKENFQNVPIDKETTIIYHEYIKIGEYNARIERWSWDGIQASSLIFLKEEVIHLTNSELTRLIRQETGIVEEFAFKDSGEFLFFSYGYEY